MLAAHDLPRLWAARTHGVTGNALGHCELCFRGRERGRGAACEMPVPHELEAELLHETGETGETVVAFALLR